MLDVQMGRMDSNFVFVIAQILQFICKDALIVMVYLIPSSASLTAVSAANSFTNTATNYPAVTSVGLLLTLFLFIAMCGGMWGSGYKF
jgi:hypothetical protein